MNLTLSSPSAVLTMHPDPLARARIVLGGPLSELIEGVIALVRGSRYLRRSVAHRMAESLTRTSLTSREIDVLRLVVVGECNMAIARWHRIQVGTVKTHMDAIFSKLHATSRTQAAAIAVARGLLEERMPVAVEHAQQANADLSPSRALP